MRGDYKTVGPHADRRAVRIYNLEASLQPTPFSQTKISEYSQSRIFQQSLSARIREQHLVAEQETQRHLNTSMDRHHFCDTMEAWVYLQTLGKETLHKYLALNLLQPNMAGGLRAGWTECTGREPGCGMKRQVCVHAPHVDVCQAMWSPSDRSCCLRLCCFSAPPWAASFWWVDCRSCVAHGPRACKEEGTKGFPSYFVCANWMGHNVLVPAEVKRAGVAFTLLHWEDLSKLLRP